MTPNRPDRKALADAPLVIRELVRSLAAEAALSESEWLTQLRRERDDG